VDLDDPVTSPRDVRIVRRDNEREAKLNSKSLDQIEHTR